MRNRKIFCFSFISILLLVAIVVCSVWRYKNNVEAANTLPGIETIQNNIDPSNPYVILEVVANKDDAKLGFLVGGEEPIYHGKSLRDMPASNERKDAMDNFDALGFSTGVDEAFSFDVSFNDSGVDKTYEIKGSFLSVDAGNGDYYYQNASSTYRAFDPATDAGLVRYTPYADADNDMGSKPYGVTFSYSTAFNETITVNGQTYAQYNRYDISSTLIEGNDADGVAALLGSSSDIYRRTLLPLDGYQYDYVGTFDVSGDDIVVVDIGGTTHDLSDYTQVGDGYCVTEIHVDRNNGDYMVTAINDSASVVNGVCDVYVHYEEDSLGGYVMESHDSGYVYAPLDPQSDLKFVPNYNGQIVDYISFSGGLANKEWLKKYTFDIETPSSFDLDVRTVTMEEFNALTLSYYNMVYIREGAYTTQIDSSQAQNLLDEVIKNKMPVVIESGFGNSGSDNNHKLSVLLRNKISNYPESGVNFSMSAAELTNYESKVISFSGSLYANSNVLICSDGQFAANDFVTEITDTSLYASDDAPLYPVYAEILRENFYREIAKKDSLANRTVTKATALRYIINFSNQRVIVKSSINVLEIEPCYSFANYTIGGGRKNDLLDVRVPGRGNVRITNTDFRTTIDEEYIATNWAPQFENNLAGITLTQTYTKEFIGKVEDLNETYDLIYIGLDTSTMNTVVNGTVKDPKATVYNDGEMTGMIYTHVGDTIEDTSTFTNNFRSTTMLAWDNKYSGIKQNRLSGNDITASKLRELEEYIDAGYPVVFADDFFTGGYVNSGVIDPKSNMHELAEYAAGFLGKNVFKNSEVKNSEAVQKRLANYLNISKLLSVDMKDEDMPAKYVYGVDGTSNMLRPINGEYVLSYTFSLRNDAAVDVADTKYNVELYLDTSVDGRFSSLEKLPSITVQELLSTGEWSTLSQVDGKYGLIGGKTYRLKKTVPEGYRGVLPWKLQFSQNDNPLIRKSVTGYTAIPRETTSQEINVLNITPSNGSSKFSLDNTTVKKYLKDVEENFGFNIKITTETAKEFIAGGTFLDIFVEKSGYDANDYYADLERYDMLIIGFSDMYAFGSPSYDDLCEEAAKAIDMYIRSGKSVLFAHDTTSFYNNPPSFFWNITGWIGGLFGTQFTEVWGYAFNTYIRDSVGMDRFGSSQNASATQVRDYYGVNASEGKALTQGYSDSIINRFYTKTSNSDTTYRASTRQVFYGDESNRGGATTGTYSVQAINDGQIRHFPFEIDESFQVANTHAQYYQLNLDTNPTDADLTDDIVVWYTLSDISGSATDDIYQANPKDVRNNYYIYSKGNVMYTGVGHSTVSNEMEIKLFINTMVAAYTAGTQPPRVTYTDGEGGLANVDTTYVPFDAVTNEFVNTSAEEQTVSFYFEIADNSFMQGERVPEVHYYVEDTSGKLLSKVLKGDSDITPQSDTNPKVKEISAEIYANGVKVNSSNLSLDTPYEMRVPVSSVLSGKNMNNIYVVSEVRYKVPYEVPIVGGVPQYPSSGKAASKMKVIRLNLFDMN